MGNILLPDSISAGEEPQEEQRVIEVTHQATQEDEEKFMLLYFLHLQPSEYDKLEPSFRQWLVARFMGQKQMEQQAMAQQQLLRKLGPNLKGG